MQTVLEIIEEVNTLVINETSVEILTVGVQGPQGPEVQRYVHQQTNQATEWIVNHNLNKKPVTVILDSGGNVIDAQILHASNNQLRVYFSLPFSGTVECL